MRNEPNNGQESCPVPSTAGLWSRVKKATPTVLIWARCLFPLFTGLLLLVMSVLYTVQGVILGKRYEVSILRLIGNTFAGTHDYLGGERKEAGDRLYTALSIGAIVSVLAFLAALFLAGLTVYTFVRAQKKDAPLTEVNRMKMIFKVAYPNRVCLFLSSALYLIPTLFPHYYAALSAQYAILSGTSVFYVLLNRPLIAVVSCLLVTLLLSLITPRYERARAMDMFALDVPPASSNREEI